MPRPFSQLDNAQLDPDIRKYKEQVEDDFAAIEEFFTRMEANSKRLKTVKEFPMPTLAAPFELGTVYSLRALELAEGAVLLIEQGNQASAFPVLRSLYEVWTAIAYAISNFEKLVIRGTQWQKFDALAHRLILGTNGHRQGPPAIPTSRMVSAAERELLLFGRTDPTVGDSLATNHKQTYAELCDGSHPTQWGVIGHAEVRDDGLGIHWYRKPQADGNGFIIDLALSLRLIRDWLPRFEITGKQIEEAARKAAALDPSIRKETVRFLRMLLNDNEVDLVPGTRARVEEVLTYLESQLG